MRHLVVVAVVAVVALPRPGAAQALRFQCLPDAASCLAAGADRSANLVVRRDVATPVTFAWDAEGDPTAGGRTVRLFAGNPEQADALRDHGPLRFTRAGDGRARATVEVPGAELGRGSFVLVAVAQGDGREEILDWRGLRLLTADELERERACATPGSAWGVTVDPALLSVETAHGSFPRSDGERDRVWWCFAGREDTSDLDLDGPYNGAPGLGVHVSSVWQGRPEDLADRVRGAFGEANGHRIHFGDLTWSEQPDREVVLSDRRRVTLRSFYTVVTLHTSASVRAFGTEQVGTEVNPLLRLFVKPRYFAHETSARLAHPDDPRFWASYSERAMGADPARLHLLARRVGQGRSIPGLPGIQTEDGDGGDTTYTVGLQVKVRPWDEPGEALPRDRLGAGIVAAEVVAARTGIGGVRSAGSGAASGLERAFCQVVRCQDPGGAVDLDRPPDGFRTTQPLAALGTMSGNLPLVLDAPKIAQRGVAPAGQPAAVRLSVNPADLPQQARLALTARLRAGALLQEDSWGYFQNLVPIDAYAQFVVKLTVAQFPGAVTPTANDPAVASLNELTRVTSLPEPTGLWAWVKKHGLALGILGGLAAALVILALVPGGLGVVRAAVGVVTKALRLILDAVSFRLDRARARQKAAEERSRSGEGGAA